VLSRRTRIWTNYFVVWSSWTESGRNLKSKKRRQRSRSMKRKARNWRMPSEITRYWLSRMKSISETLKRRLCRKCTEHLRSKWKTRVFWVWVAILGLFLKWYLPKQTCQEPPAMLMKKNSYKSNKRNLNKSTSKKTFREKRGRRSFKSSKYLRSSLCLVKKLEHRKVRRLWLRNAS